MFPISQNGLRSDLKEFEKDGHYVTLWVKNAQKVSFSPFLLKKALTVVGLNGMYHKGRKYMKKSISSKLLNVLLSTILVLSTLMVKPVMADELGSTVPKELFEFKHFGDNAADSRNPEPEVYLTSDEKEISRVTMMAEGGKVSEKSEGLSLFYTTLHMQDDFKFSAYVSVDSFNEKTGISSNNQKSFGITLRDNMGTKTDAHVSLGVFNTRYYSLQRDSGAESLNKIDFGVSARTSDQGRFSVIKYGHEVQFSLEMDGEVYYSHHNLSDLGYSDELYVGFYVARDAMITFDDIELVDASDVVASDVDVTLTSNKFYKDSVFDYSLLSATHKGKNIPLNELIVSGFDASIEGKQTLYVQYRNVLKEIEVEIIDNKVEKLIIDYKPAKLDYILGESFDPLGLKVSAEYTDGTIKSLSFGEYEIMVPSDFETSAKTHVIELVTKGVKTSLSANVKDVSVVGLQVNTDKATKQYYLHDKFDLRGLVVDALYSDGSSKRLSQQDYQVELNGIKTNAHEVDYVFTNADIKNQFEVKILFQDQVKSFKVKVDDLKEQAIVIKDYPQTTFKPSDAIEEVLNQDLVLAIQYNNGDLVSLDKADYTLVMPSNFEVGTKSVQVKYKGALGVKDIHFDISIKEAQTHDFIATRFGQSTSASKNTIDIYEDYVRIVADNGAGKITQDHDGISYYYTKLNAKEDNFEIEATIKVNDYAKKPHDGQESFGIMARDAIGKEKDSSVFASNIAAVGGFAGGTGKPNGIQLFTRSGVDSSDGAGSLGLETVMLQEGTGISTYKLSLRKTNSGFEGRMIDLATNEDSGWKSIYAPNLLELQDENMYVGFYTARVADIEVRDIVLSTSSAKTDAPTQDAPVVNVDLNLENSTRQKTANEHENIRLKSNADGVLYVSLDKQNGERVNYGPFDIRAHELFTHNLTLEKGLNKLIFRFVPDAFANLNDFDEQIFYRDITYREYEGDIYVSPEGLSENEGSIDSPLDIYTAIEFVKPGQSVYVGGGEYHLSETLNFAEGNDGLEDKPKYFFAQNAKDRPVLNFGKKVQGIRLAADYWHFKNIDVTGSKGDTAGVNIGGNYNIVEGMKTYRNGGTGLQISRTNTSNNIEDWPSHNLVLNSDSFDNQDPSNNNADGFGAKLTVGHGNKFKGCTAYNNIDDGWDLYTKVGTGAIGVVEIEDSIAYNNGWVTHDEDAIGDGNGFKLGGEGVHVPHVIKNSIAFHNLTSGLTSNSNPGVIAQDIISFDNGKANINLTTYVHIQEDFQMENIYSFRSEDKMRDVNIKSNTKDEYPKEKKSETTFMFDGTSSTNTKGMKLVASNFRNTSNIKIERDDEGYLILSSLPSLLNASYSLNQSIELNDNFTQEEIIQALNITTDDAYTLDILSDLSTLKNTKAITLRLSFYEGSVNEMIVEENISVSFKSSNTNQGGNDDQNDTTPDQNTNETLPSTGSPSLALLSMVFITLGFVLFYFSKQRKEDQQ